MDSMNPNSSSEIPAMQLPPPMEAPAATPDKGSEKAPAGSETAARPAAAAPVAAAPTAVPLPMPPVTPAGAPPAPSAAGSTALSVKDDGDLIEKEWVNKAKQIVERTREDPYKQSEELTVFKADYMKQRYNKTIKLK
jgi:hypothetical protein